MPILTLIVITVLIGVAMWAINRWLGPYIQPPWLKILNVVVVILYFVWLLNVLGIFHLNLGTVPRVG